MSDPCVSSAAHDALVVVLIFAVFGIYLVAQGAALVLKGARKLSVAKLGEGLLEVSGGDRKTAETWISSARADNAAFDAAIKRACRVMQPWRAAGKFPLWDDLA